MRPLGKDRLARFDRACHQLLVLCDLYAHDNEIDVRMIHEIFGRTQSMGNAKLFRSSWGCRKSVVADSCQPNFRKLLQCGDVGDGCSPFSGWTPMIPTLIGSVLMSALFNSWAIAGMARHS